MVRVIGWGLGAALIAATASSALASDLSACRADAARLCAGVEPGGGRILACFKQHPSELSQGCKEALADLKAERGGGPAAGAAPAPGDAAAVPASVPDADRATYAALAQALDRAEATYRPDDVAGLAKPEYFTDLLAANSNAGEALLRSQMMEAVTVSLDAFKRMGLTGVKFAVQYPILTPNFPRSVDYLAFYRRVADEARARGLKILPHVTVVFANTAFSSFKGIYDKLTPERFAAEYKAMVARVIAELHPDYLGLITEPDTLVRLTGLKQFGEPDALVRLVNDTLDGLDRGPTKICAGAGSWNGVPFAKALSSGTTMDAVCIHIYPTTGALLDDAAEMARIAKAAGKSAWIDEAWLYKTRRPGGGDNVAAAEGVFGQDVYAFWQPLDIRFFRLANALARRGGVDLLSFFWSRQFFAALPAGEGGEDWRARSQAANRASFTAMKAGRLTELGQAYKALIAAP